MKNQIFLHNMMKYCIFFIIWDIVHQNLPRNEVQRNLQVVAKKEQGSRLLGRSFIHTKNNHTNMIPSVNIYQHFKIVKTNSKLRHWTFLPKFPS